MTDHIARVREQAEREAFDRVDAHLRDSADPQPAKFRSGYRVGFVEGAAWAASHLTREKIARALAGGDWALMDRHNSAICLADADAILALLTVEEQR